MMNHTLVLFRVVTEQLGHYDVPVVAVLDVVMLVHVYWSLTFIFIVLIILSTSLKKMTEIYECNYCNLKCNPPLQLL